MNRLLFYSLYFLLCASLEIARDIVLTMTAKHPNIRELLHYDTGFYMVLFSDNYLHKR